MKTVVYGAILLLLLAASVESQAATIFVATTGSDTNPGTLERPLATLQKAQQAARKAAGREAVTVLVRAGTYYLPETLIITAADSGTEAAPVVYRAYEKEQAVISGGVRLKNLKWEPYKDRIMQAKLPAGIATDQLFVNGARQPMARYPNFNPQERHFNGWDYNLIHRAGATDPRPATNLAAQSKRDGHSIVADAMFVDPADGDFRVKEGSPALKLGFLNFPMDQFGVRKPELKAIARTPAMPKRS